jgi:hypothetical protein
VVAGGVPSAARQAEKPMFMRVTVKIGRKNHSSSAPRWCNIDGKRLPDAGEPKSENQAGSTPAEAK